MREEPSPPRFVSRAGTRGGEPLYLSSSGNALVVLAEGRASRPSGPFAFLRVWAQRQAVQKERLAGLGVAAVVAYGLFDAVTYTIAFMLAFLSYEKTAGVNPAKDLKVRRR